MQALNVGNIVKSAAGHDTGRLYVIIGIDPPFAYVADGGRRRVAGPKRKRQKHLKFVAAGEDRIFTDLAVKRIIKSAE